MSVGITQKCRLLLEGREVPFVSATIIADVGQPLSATIDLVPLSIIKFVVPKTQVQLFVQDSFNFGDLNYYLAFEGEVTGRAMMKRDNARSFQITAVDYSGYWDEAKAYYYNPNFLVGKLGAILQGELPPAQEEQAQGASQIINQALASGATTDLIDGVVNVIKSLKNINLFYTSAFNRLRITDRIRIFSGGNLRTFLQDLDMDEFLQSYTGKQGGMVSLREMLINVMQLIFHDFVSVPFPPLVGVNGGTSGQTTIGNFLFVPDGYPLPAPKCNVIFPNYIQSFEFQDDFRSQLTRFAFRSSFPAFFQSVNGGTANAPVIDAYPIQFYPTGFSDYMFHTHNETTQEYQSLLGTSSILLDPSDPTKTYNSLYYAKTNTGQSSSVGGIAVSPTLREADYLTNDESIRGIFLDMETFLPGMSTLATHNKTVDVGAFTHEIGLYMFFKKRFSSRNGRAQLMFHPFLVPGFNGIVVDDSDAGQSFVAKIQQVVHNITNAGCSTTVQLGYARTFDEVDALTGGCTEPPLPKWFDNTKFGGGVAQGVPVATLFSAETTFLQKLGFLGPQAINGATGTTELAARQKVATQPNALTVYNHMCGFFQFLLACDAVTDVDSTLVKSSLVTPRGAAYFLTEKFKRLSNRPDERDNFVTKYIRRPIPSMASAMYFVGAVPVGTNATIPDSFARFKATTHGAQAGLFDGLQADGSPNADQKILQIRRNIVNQYVTLLRTARGYRG